MLEDWLLQSFDDYITTFNATKNEMKNSVASLSDSNECIILIDENCESTKTTITALKTANLCDLELDKKQEINYIILQVLTNLLACGVIEYSNSFENAINKIFKVCTCNLLLIYAENMKCFSI